MKKVFSRWFVAHEDQVHGPVEPEAVRGALEAGRITASSLVCREGDKTWVELKDVPAFSGLCSSSAPSQFTPAPEMHAEEREALGRRDGVPGATSIHGARPGPSATTSAPSSKRMFLVIALAIVVPTAGFCVVAAFALGARRSGATAPSPPEVRTLTGCWLAQNPSLHICLNGDGSFQSRMPDGRRGAGSWELAEGELTVRAATGPTAGTSSVWRVVSVSEQSLTLAQADLHGVFQRAGPLPPAEAPDVVRALSGPAGLECWTPLLRLREEFPAIEPNEYMVSRGGTDEDGRYELAAFTFESPENEEQQTGYSFWVHQERWWKAELRWWPQSHSRREEWAVGILERFERLYGPARREAITSYAVLYRWEDSSIEITFGVNHRDQGGQVTRASMSWACKGDPPAEQ